MILMNLRRVLIMKYRISYDQLRFRVTYSVIGLSGEHTRWFMTFEDAMAFVYERTFYHFQKSNP